MADVTKIDWETKTSAEDTKEAAGESTGPKLEEESIAIQDIYNAIRLITDQSNDAKKGAFVLADGKTVTFSATIGKSSFLTISVTSGRTTKTTNIPLK